MDSWFVKMDSLINGGLSLKDFEISRNMNQEESRYPVVPLEVSFLLSLSPLDR